MNRMRSNARGQTLTELALVLPLFLSVLFGIIILGIGVFYQQQVTNAAREAARFASVSSGTAQCPTNAHLDPRIGKVDPISGRVSTGLAPQSYALCDTPQAGWPGMTGSARALMSGIDASSVQIAACWSGYVTTTQYDAPPVALSPSSSWAPCLIDGQNPSSSPRSCNPDNPSDTGCIHCTAGIGATTVDTGSDISEGPGRVVANTVTGYSCYVWTPPLAGFLVIPKQVVLQGVITEPMERQQ